MEELIANIINLLFFINEEKIEDTDIQFSHLEKKLLFELCTLFDYETKIKLQKQLKELNIDRKQRRHWRKCMRMELLGTKKSSMFHNNGKRENNNNVSKLASVQFKIKDNKPRKYEILFEKKLGRIWGWKIEPNPKKIMNAKEIEIISHHLYSNTLEEN